MSTGNEIVRWKLINVEREGVEWIEGAPRVVKSQVDCVRFTIGETVAIFPFKYFLFRCT